VCVSTAGALRRRPIPHALHEPKHGAVEGSLDWIIHGRRCCGHQWWRWPACAGAVDDAPGEATHERAVSFLEDSRVGGDHKVVLELLPAGTRPRSRRERVQQCDDVGPETSCWWKKSAPSLTMIGRRTKLHWLSVDSMTVGALLEFPFLPTAKSSRQRL